MPVFDHVHPKTIERTFSLPEFPPASKKSVHSINSFLGHSSQIHQIHVKSKILKSLKSSPFDSHIENRKFPKFQLHRPNGSDFMAILGIFSSGFEHKMSFGAFSRYH